MKKLTWSVLSVGLVMVAGGSLSASAAPRPSTAAKVLTTTNTPPADKVVSPWLQYVGRSTNTPVVVSNSDWFKDMAAKRATAEVPLSPFDRLCGRFDHRNLESIKRVRGYDVDELLIGKEFDLPKWCLGFRLQPIARWTYEQNDLSLPYNSVMAGFALRLEF